MSQPKTLLAEAILIAVLTLSASTTLSAQSAQDAFERQDQQIRSTILFALIPVVVAFSFIIFVFYRSKRESFFKQKEAEFKLSISELELRALRAQINPHFIFNCLNSIHHYIHQQDAAQAGEYLVKFSQLIRYVLETSSSRMVPIADDVEALKIYMELERLRMHQTFDFEIITESIPDPMAIYIPPMMIQPFVENSIWHGLAGKGAGGQIRIVITRHEDTVKCIIEDNGEKKEKAVSLSPIKKTSMGMSLIKERLVVVSHLHRVKADFIMENRSQDPDQGGTRIILTIPFED